MHLYSILFAECCLVGEKEPWRPAPALYLTSGSSWRTGAQGAL